MKPASATGRFLLEVAIEPRGKQDHERLHDVLKALEKCHAFAVTTDRDSGQTILHGPDEITLDMVFGDLNAAGIDLNIGAPQVAYRETITAPALVNYTHKKMTFGHGEFGRVAIEFVPVPQDDGPIASLLDVGTLPPALRDGAIRGIESVFSAGILAGFPVVGVAATIRDAAWHETDSTPKVFEIAARAATREALSKGRAVLLEPWMSIEASGPNHERVLADLKARRGEIDASRDGILRGHVPFSSMFGYINSHRAITEGRGTWSMEFDGYRPVPRPFDDDDGPLAPAAAMKA